jgi:hypothetical protein
MKRIFLALAAIIVTAATADAGCRFPRLKARAKARPHVRRVVADVKAVASVPVKVVQARPVATCVGGVCK